MSGAWLTYLARCQHMLRQGIFVADFAFLQSEAIPSFIPPRPSQRPTGFDYDAMNAEVLLRRATAKDGRLALPDGMSYGYLVLPSQADAILLPMTLKKINELAEAGVPVIGPKTLAASIPKMREGPLDAVTRTDCLAPDIEFRRLSPQASLDWIHRRVGEIDIYFVANLASVHATVEAIFRTTGKQPELWDAVTGTIRDLPVWRAENGRTAVPLCFEPRQSWFVVFRKAGEATGSKTAENFSKIMPMAEIAGPWQVSFDPKWGGPCQVVFQKLGDWSQRPEPGIKYYSGIATYKKTFVVSRSSLPASRSQIYLDLGTVKNVARVKLNSRDLGVVWTAPWHVEVTDMLRSGANELEIEVANLWPNRLIGDAALPTDRRLTKTNVRTYDTMSSGTWGCQVCADRKRSGQPAMLLTSGLLGPVTVCVPQTASR